MVGNDGSDDGHAHAQPESDAPSLRGEVGLHDLVDDAWAVIDEIVEDGDELALVLSDHRLPGKSGVDFLVELMQDERFGATRTVLVTGQADQSDTIRAVNQAGLDYYIGKPWDPEELRAAVRDQLTEYVLEVGVDPLPYVSVLDGVRVMEAIR